MAEPETSELEPEWIYTLRDAILRAAERASGSDQAELRRSAQRLIDLWHTGVEGKRYERRLEARITQLEMASTEYEREGSVVTGPGLEFHAPEGKLVCETVAQADRMQRMLQCAYNLGAESVRKPIVRALGLPKIDGRNG